MSTYLDNFFGLRGRDSKRERERERREKNQLRDIEQRLKTNTIVMRKIVNDEIRLSM